MNRRLNKIKRLYESVSKNSYKKFTLKESKLNEGAGAGYTVSGLVTELNVTNILTKKLDAKEDYKLHCNCEGTANITNLHASSYMYGNDIAPSGEIPVKVTSVIVYLEDEEKEKIKDDAWLLELINSNGKFNFDASCGGGWTHAPFDGKLEARADESSSNIDTATLVIENDRVTIFDPYEEPYISVIPMADFLNAWKESNNYMIQVLQSVDEYEPHPIDVDSIPLDGDLEELQEAIAENAHDVWAKARKKEGWTYGKERDDSNKLHPDLVPYTALPDSEKEYDRIMAFNTIKLVKKLGFDIVKRNNQD